MLHGAWIHQRALFFTHEYYPGAQTLHERYLVRHVHVPEVSLWAYICQLVTALRAIHALGLACRVMHPLRVLWTSQNRVRVNCVGVIDVLEAESAKSIEDAQREDIFNLGRLILALACRMPVGSLDRIGLSEALDSCRPHYTPEVVNLTAMSEFTYYFSLNFSVQCSPHVVAALFLFLLTRTMLVLTHTHTRLSARRRSQSQPEHL